MTIRTTSKRTKIIIIIICNAFSYSLLFRTELDREGSVSLLSEEEEEGGAKEEEERPLRWSDIRACIPTIIILAFLVFFIAVIAPYVFKVAYR